MGLGTAQDLANLIAIRSGLIATLAAEVAFELANGPKPSYSLDGESVSWTEYRASVTEQIEKYNALIQAEQTPFVIRSRARA